MKSDITKWLQNPTVSPKATMTITILWVSLLLGLQWFYPSRSKEARLVSPLLFKAREAMGAAPTLDPHIKLFALDDTSVNYLHHTDLDLPQWASVLEALDSRHPKAIIIDALFSVVDADSVPGGKEAIERIEAIKTPIYSGSFPAQRRIYGRIPIPLNDARYKLDTYLPDVNIGIGGRIDALAKLQIADFRSNTVYGANPTTWRGFHRPGHILYGDDEGNFYPLLRLDNGQALPHVMLMPFQDTMFSEDRLRVHGTEFVPARDGSVPIDFVAVKNINPSVTPISKLINEKKKADALKKVDEGDFVYIMPLFYTGNTDFKPSPIGLLPAAFSHLNVLNSILKGSSLRYLEAEPVLIISFAAAVAFFGWWLNPATLILTLLGGSVLWGIACVLAFTYQGMVLPYIFPQLSMSGVGISLLLQRIYVSERKSRMIRQALEGIVRPESLKSLQKNPEKLHLGARERVVTIMFIDIVGFSLMVENQVPRVAFSGLQQLIEMMSLCVHRHGGIVNKTLGDGLLCFFGYSLEEDRETNHHAEEALAAAMEIQRINLPRILESVDKGQAVYPLRIGINTAAVFMGNLGTGERLDITVIGHGVNFAKRLESACLAHSVLVGPTTHELIFNKNKFGTSTRRFISIKHREDMVEAWEYDPFEDDIALRQKADRIYENSLSHHRVSRKAGTAGIEKVLVISEGGSAELLSVSDKQMVFFSSMVLRRGTRLEIKLDTVDRSLNRQLTKQGLQKILIEVERVETEDSLYLVTATFVGLDLTQVAVLTDLLWQFGPKPQAQEVASRSAS